MKQLSDQELQQIKDLLRHTGEFIAYFELAETKLVAWRHQQQESFDNQQSRFDQQQQAIQKDLDSVKDTLSEAGIARLKVQLNEAITLFEKKIASLSDLQQTISDIFGHEKLSLSKAVSQCTREIEEHCQETVNKIEAQLSDYDVDYFRRIAADSCDQVEQVAQTAVQTSTKMMRNFQWRTATLVLITTLVTSLTIGMYISDEWPWEIHQVALNEREAGKVLIKAWPSLSHQERERILTHEVNNLG
ncbi:hypothetical protein [Legionella sp. W05-934-2]|jgi:hypothetical protein|uniref:hypothetical protein n=1 Tax=Legionella sp. W05-934-2 TaxID=1198649 RepID=UPI003462AD00